MSPFKLTSCAVKVTVTAVRWQANEVWKRLNVQLYFGVETHGLVLGLPLNGVINHVGFGFRAKAFKQCNFLNVFLKLIKPNQFQKAKSKSPLSCYEFPSVDLQEFA